MSKYTRDQDSYILANYGKIPASKIGSVLGISRCCVIGRHWRLTQKKKRAGFALKGFKEYLDEINRSHL